MTSPVADLALAVVSDLLPAGGTFSAVAHQIMQRRVEAARAVLLAEIADFGIPDDAK